MSYCLSLTNCPSEFYESCTNATALCHKCSAGFGASKTRVYYSPNPNSPFCYGDHPHVQEKKLLEKSEKLVVASKIDRKKSRQIKSAYNSERLCADKVIKQTVRSGARYGDGDFQSLDGLLQGDHKLRYNTKNFNVTWDEYTSGRRAGTNSWFISVTGDDDKPHTLVCLTMDAYTALLNLAVKGLEKD